MFYISKCAQEDRLFNEPKNITTSLKNYVKKAKIRKLSEQPNNWFFLKNSVEI